MVFQAGFPLFAVFSDVRDDVVEGEDLRLLDTPPNDEPAIANGIVDFQEINRSSVEHGDDPFALVLGGESGDAGGGTLREGEGCSGGSVIRKEGFVCEDFFGEGQRAFAEEAFLISHGKREDHFWAVCLVTLNMKSESVFFLLLAHAVGRCEQGESADGDD